MSIISSPLVLIGLPGCLLLLVVLLTRPTWRRGVGATLAGLTVAGLDLLVDMVAHAQGWWSYPAMSTSYGPLLFYVATGLWYGSGVALIGWRLLRRFGQGGLLGLLGGMAVYGPVRDLLGAAATGVIAFGPGPVPLLADASSWAGLTAVAQGVMWVVAGPASADPLAPPVWLHRRHPCEK